MKHTTKVHVRLRESENVWYFSTHLSPGWKLFAATWAQVSALIINAEGGGGNPGTHKPVAPFVEREGQGYGERGCKREGARGATTHFWLTLRGRGRGKEGAIKSDAAPIFWSFASVNDALYNSIQGDEKLAYPRNVHRFFTWRLFPATLSNDPLRHDIVCPKTQLTRVGGWGGRRAGMCVTVIDV